MHFFELHSAWIFEKTQRTKSNAYLFVFNKHFSYFNPIWHGVKSNLFDMGGGHLAPPLYFPNEKSYILNIAYITSLGYLLSEYTPLYPRVTWQNCWRCIFQTLSAKIRENPNFLAQKWVSFDKKVNPLVQTWKVGNRDWKHSINAPFHP